MKVTTQDVLRVVNRDVGGDRVSEQAVIHSFETARGLIRRLKDTWTFDEATFRFLIGRQSPPPYVGEANVAALVAEVLHQAEGLQDSFAVNAELRVENQKLTDEIDALHRQLADGKPRTHFAPAGGA